jgi:hypothetical protein
MQGTNRELRFDPFPIAAESEELIAVILQFSKHTSRTKEIPPPLAYALPIPDDDDELSVVIFPFAMVRFVTSDLPEEASQFLIPESR